MASTACVNRRPASLRRRTRCGRRLGSSPWSGATPCGPGEGRLYRIAIAEEPSWAPAGNRIAAAQQGWVVIVDVRNHRVRRLARGSAPAFSPDGRWIAFVAPEHRLMIVAARGGRARRVGRVRAVSVDWQPRPRVPSPGCAAPPGSTVIASTRDAVITQDGMPPPAAGGIVSPVAYMGCLRADGRERLLDRFATNNIDGASWITSAVLAAPYAALTDHSADEHYGGSGAPRPRRSRLLGRASLLHER
jgi:WD40-like Beta Propeller Repeat